MCSNTLQANQINKILVMTLRKSIYDRAVMEIADLAGHNCKFSKFVVLWFVTVTWPLHETAK